LTIISVNFDETRELWEKDITTENLPWKMLSDLTAFKGELAKDYSVTSIPRIFLIDPNGKIVSSKLRGEKILNQLEDIYVN
jgi:thioredoxin-related protein